MVVPHASSSSHSPRQRPALVVHGGAGTVDPARRPRALEGCRRAAEDGWRCLADGGSALDAVEVAVTRLENDPEFNAGTGSVRNAAGEIQMDASLMDGHDRRAGAVAAVQRLRNPIAAVRRVLDDGRHVLLAGAGAERFAEAAGLPLCANRDLIVERATPSSDGAPSGTVGCVALDQAGRLAAGTSTGGTRGALPGRIGDSPLIGAGTYADRIGAVSCTGHGEALIRAVLAHTATELLARGLSAEETVAYALSLLQGRAPGEAGLILLDREGRATWACNTPHMPVAHARADGTTEARIVTSSV